MAIGFFGRGDLMRQRMYWNAQRYAMPLSEIARGSVVDVGTMPGSVEMAAPGQPAAVPAVSGYGSYDGWGRVTPFQALTYPGLAAAGPVGWAAIAANEKSLKHARKQRDHFKKLFGKLKKKKANKKRLSKVHQKYLHWARTVVRLEHQKAERKHFKAAKKAIRKGKAVPLSPAQKRMLKLRAKLRAQQAVTGQTYVRRPGMGLQTAAQAASSAGLVSSSAQGAMVPPGSYDYLPAQALPTTATSSAYAPSQLVRAQDVDINDDGVRDDIPYSADAMATGQDAAAADGTTTDETAIATEDEGIMSKVGDFFGGVSKWWLVGGAVVVGGVVFSRTAAGKKLIAKLKRKGGGGGGSAE